MTFGADDVEAVVHKGCAIPQLAAVYAIVRRRDTRERTAAIPHVCSREHTIACIGEEGTRVAVGCLCHVVFDVCGLAVAEDIWVTGGIRSQHMVIELDVEMPCAFGAGEREVRVDKSFAVFIPDDGSWRGAAAGVWDDIRRETARRNVDDAQRLLFSSGLLRGEGH